MKMIIFMLIILLVAAQPSIAQNNRLWATYYGGTANEGAFATVTDVSDGSVYMAGITQSSSGISASGFQNTFGGGIVDAYLVKFDSAGHRLWATYYGGPGDEMSFLGGKMGLAIDNSGNVYLAGQTSSSSGIASGGFQNSLIGAVNAYLVKFSSSGSRIWATYYGGASVEKAYSVATDNSGNVYLAGVSGTTTGIASGGFQNTHGGGTDAFLVKFDSAGNRIWATYYGGSNNEEGFCVATDNASNVYLAGITNSTSGIAAGGHQNTHGGGSSDIFLVKFNSAGAREWATYYGGSGDEMQYLSGDIGIATDTSANVYLTGLTSSVTGIASSGSFQSIYGGGASDAFLAKFNSSGIRQWATYYGGADEDKGYDVTADNVNNIYLVGRTRSSSVIGTAGFQSTLGGGIDAFIAKFDTTGNRHCGSYYGAVDVDECNSVSVDAKGNMYLAGGSANTSGIAFGGFQNIHGGGVSDAMLVKFSPCDLNTLAITEKQVENLSLNIWPNPTEGIFRIKIDARKFQGHLTITNVTGKIVFDKSDFNTSEDINISCFERGTYIVTFKGNEIAYHEVLVYY